MEWSNYPGNRLIFHHPSGFSIIKPSELLADQQPLFCPICDGIMNSNYDDDSFVQFKCCDNCASYWAYPNKEKWKEGWRPSVEEVRDKYKNR